MLGAFTNSIGRWLEDRIMSPDTDGHYRQVEQEDSSIGSPKGVSRRDSTDEDNRTVLERLEDYFFGGPEEHEVHYRRGRPCGPR